MSEKIGIIDLGSNSARLNIYAIYEDGSYRVVDEAKESVRLSENMAEDNLLKPKSIDRTISVLKMYKKLMDSYNIKKSINIATAGVRNALNGDIFLKKVNQETGLNMRVISGEEEGYLGYMGVVNTIDFKDFVIMDTGGGSTEISLIRDRKIQHTISLPLGAVVLTEKFLNSAKKVTTDGIKDLNTFIEEELKKCDWLDECEGLPIVGLGGSIRSLFKIDKNDRDLPIDKVSQYNLSVDMLKDIFEDLKSKSIDERKFIRGLAKDRADIIIGGLAPVIYISDKINATEIIVSNTGLREGIFFDYYFKEINPDFDFYNSSVLERSIENTLKNFEINIIHSRHVAKLAVSMFEQLKDLHGIKDEYLRILYAAAMLHDLGTYVNYDNHNKHSMYLILNSNINGLDSNELIKVALIAYLHDDETLKLDLKDYSTILDRKDVEIIRKLGCFVNMAEKLDRNESACVEEINCYQTKESVEILINKSDSSEYIIEKGFEDYKIFKKLFGKSLFVI